MTQNLTASVINNPSGKPDITETMKPSDFIQILDDIGVEEAIRNTADRAEMECQRQIRGSTYTVTVRPYLAHKNQPEFWLEAMTRNEDTGAETTVAVARVRFADGDKNAQAAKQAAALLASTRREKTTAGIPAYTDE